MTVTVIANNDDNFTVYPQTDNNISSPSISMESKDAAPVVVSAPITVNAPCCGNKKPATVSAPITVNAPCCGNKKPATFGFSNYKSAKVETIGTPIQEIPEPIEVPTTPIDFPAPIDPPPLPPNTSPVRGSSNWFAGTSWGN